MRRGSRADPFAAGRPPLRRAGARRASISIAAISAAAAEAVGARLGRGRNRCRADRRCAAGPCRTAVQQPGPGMNDTGTGMGWGARVLVGFVMILAGAAAAVMGLGALSAGGDGSWAWSTAAAARRAYPEAGRDEPAAAEHRSANATEPSGRPADWSARAAPRPSGERDGARRRLCRPRRRAGSGIRRAAGVDRGVALGYLENLLSTVSVRRTVLP